MPRKPEFDRQRALEQAMKLFWRRGFHASSLEDLLAATGLSRSSFYAAFTDKRTLYTECLNLFGERTRALLHHDYDSRKPLDAISGFFRHTLFGVPPERVTWGCMMVNTVLELADSEDALQQRAMRLLGAIEQDFEALFAQAVELGQIDTTFTPRELAAHVMTLNQGLRVQSRQKLSREHMHNTLTTSLALAGLPA